MLTIAGRADEALLDAFYSELYLPAFAHQREPLEAWKRRLWDDPGYPRSNTGFLTYLVVEVSDPRTADDPAEARARLARFQRWGARVLDLAYVQPDLGAGLGRDRRLRLLAFFSRGGAPPPDVDGARVAAFLRELYAITEGAGWDDDEARAMLAAIPARAALVPP